ncbi:response regulator transcription factor [Mangrovitalea sediminis]|uniref:response regulator transcription factor n=1 Tax=Mangrovitalea sediminis TaxID=1982043 RepID=UPI00117781B8|nr:response regulator transcription factor [Mangrovitalea sediminis]
MRALLIDEGGAELARFGRVLSDHAWQVSHRRWPTPEEFALLPTTVDMVLIAIAVVDQRLHDCLSLFRQRGDDAVIIVLGEFSVEDRIKALNFGADDFLRRESPGELLLSRALALLRLRSNRFKPHYEIGDLQLDLIHRRVNRSGTEILLSHREFQLLVLLAQHAGQTLSRSFMIEHLWGQDQAADDNTLDAYVSRLRRKLDAPFETRLVSTVRGVGYRLAATDNAPAQPVRPIY